MTDTRTRLDINRDRSTVTIAGRRFPAATVICPPHADDVDSHDSTDWDRSLADGIADNSVYIPAENGVLFCVEPNDADRGGPDLMTLHLACCRCIEHEMTAQDGPMWLPRYVMLIDGELRAERDRGDVRGLWEWRNAEPEWVAETIERLSRKPFVEPDGPRVRLVPYGRVVKR